jgi:NADH:ubiquinone oxidoreductase subunit 5 (subunit L)/multisubunit Na+/H+ antiporter MnhA subunit
MEAPVPASALIHSATLVSAGIFLLGRHEILTTSELVSDFLLIWCSATALYGGLVAAYQTDLKKILAYSTISHCGFLMLLVVYNNVFGLVLYLHLHGWFKSYSFMASGNIISKYLGYQDYRRMGGSSSFISLEILVLSISISCLGGLPFLLGFFNKHYLLLLMSESVSVVSSLFTLGAAFTGLLYTVKTVYSLTAVPFKNTSSQKTSLMFGGSRILASPSEPWTNIYLFGLYPLIITALAVIVLGSEY